MNINTKKYHVYLQLAPQLYHNINKDDFNIFCLGGSTTEFKDEKGRDWPSLLEKLLNEKYPGRKIKVYNFGKQWYTSQHILINYIQNLRKYKPEIILVMENINDLLHNADFSFLSNGEFREDYGNFLGPSIRLVKSKSLIEFTGYVLKKSWYQDEPKEINVTDFPGLSSFERNLVTLIKLAKDDSTKVILMTQPNIYKASMKNQELKVLTMLNNEAIGNGMKWSYQTAFDGLKKYNNKIIEVAAEEKVQLIDLESMIPKSMEYFYDDVHYRSKSYDLISEKIFEKLEIKPEDH